MLPAIPSDVGHLAQFVEVNNRSVSVGFWFRAPNLPAADGPWGEAFLASWFSTCMPTLLGLMHTEASCTTCRLTGRGFLHETMAPPNQGAWVGATELAVALGLKWTTRESGRSSWSISYVPAVPSAFVSNHWQLNETGYSTARSQGLLLLQAFNALVDPLGATVELGVLQRKTAAGPLPASLFVGFTDVFSIQKLATLGRRIPSRGGVLPL